MQAIVLDMNSQESTFLTTKLLSNKPFHKLSYQRRADLAWPYMLFFNPIKTSNCPPSLLKSLGSSMNTGYPLGISAWEKALVKSII